MTLQELSPMYRETAENLSRRIQELRSELRAHPEDPEVRFHLKQRIHALEPMLQESRELQELTAHYYDEGLSRNGKYLL